MEAIESLEDIKQEILKYLTHFELNDRYAIFYETVSFRTEYTEELQPILERQRDSHREIIGEVEKVFQRMKEEGLVRRELNPFYAALSLAAFINGIIETWLLDRTTFSLPEAAPVTLDDFLRGLKPDSNGQYQARPELENNPSCVKAAGNFGPQDLAPILLVDRDARDLYAHSRYSGGGQPWLMRRT